MRRFYFTILLLGLVLFAGTAAAEQPTSRALGADGTLYQILHGRYGDIFPGGEIAPPENQVLALRVTQHDGVVRTVLVPGSAGPQLENHPRLVISDNVHVLWESRGATNKLILATFGGQSWGANVLVSNLRTVDRSTSRLTVTRDSYEILHDDDTRTVQERTLLHVVWSETLVNQGTQIHYAPVVLEEGLYLGAHAIYQPVDYLPDDRPVSETPVSSKLLQTPTVRPGTNAGTVVVAFVDPVSGQLTSMDFRVLPGELSHLAEIVRETIVQVGESLDLSDPTSLSVLVGSTRHQLIDVGARLHQDLLQGLADQVEAYVMARGCGPQCNVEGLAQGAYRHMLEAAVQWTELDVVAVAEGTRHQLIDVGARINADIGPISLHLRVRPTAQRPLPEVGSENLAIYLSSSGEHFLIAWENEGNVFFRETVAEGWNPVYHLGEDGGVESVRALLENRVDNRQ
ncbi:MAG: hypothetical protein AAF604_01315 [Acidobacteriota bacterium]